MAAIISIILEFPISSFLKLVKPSPAVAGIIIGISMAIIFFLLYKYL